MSVLSTSSFIKVLFSLQKAIVRTSGRNAKNCATGLKIHSACPDTPHRFLCNAQHELTINVDDADVFEEFKVEERELKRTGIEWCQFLHMEAEPSRRYGGW